MVMPLIRNALHVADGHLRGILDVHHRITAAQESIQATRPEAGPAPAPAPSPSTCRSPRSTPPGPPRTCSTPCCTASTPAGASTSVTTTAGAPIPQASRPPGRTSSTRPSSPRSGKKQLSEANGCCNTPTSMRPGGAGSLEQPVTTGFHGTASSRYTMVWSSRDSRP
ncbi:hypothetical protein HD597_007074 [Nonomuraea thailandensis]|uniref:Uncharacterized protein n=1 Tax=Nonomuraea thailandensis TaxID=1188745 RepID=A0A9X2K523_9ACTN|nr:hypothetical protein [Nonomuraea thailandensis]